MLMVCCQKWEESLWAPWWGELAEQEELRPRALDLFFVVQNISFVICGETFFFEVASVRPQKPNNPNLTCVVYG